MIVKHQLPGRLRLYIDDLENNHRLSKYLTHKANKNDLLGESRFNARTGHALIHYDKKEKSTEDILAAVSGIIADYKEITSDIEGAPLELISAGILGPVNEAEDQPIKRQIVNVALGGFVLIIFSAKRIITGRSGLAGSTVLFNLAAVTTIITSYPLFKSALSNLAKDSSINHDVLTASLSLILILLRESIPGLTVVWLSNVLSLVESLVLKSAYRLSESVIDNNTAACPANKEADRQEQEESPVPRRDDFLENHYITSSARAYGEKISSTSLFLSTLVGLKTRQYERSLSVLLASSPGAAGQAFPSSLAGAMALASNFGILVKGREAIARAAEMKVLALTHSSQLAPSPAPGLVLPVDGSPENWLAPAYTLARNSKYYRDIFLKEQGVAEEELPPLQGDLQIDTPEGIKGATAQGEILLGSRKMLEEAGIKTGMADFKVRRLCYLYQSPVFVAQNGELAGVIGVRRTVPEKYRDLLYVLKAAGVDTLLITRESEEEAAPVKAQAPVELLAETFPSKIPDILKEITPAGGILAVLGNSTEDRYIIKEAGLSLVFKSSPGLCPWGDIVISDDLCDVLRVMKIGRVCCHRATQNLLATMGLNLLGLALSATGRITPAGAALYNNLISIGVNLNSLRIMSGKKLISQDFCDGNAG